MAKEYGPFTVTKADVNTGLVVEPAVRLDIRADGAVNVGSGILGIPGPDVSADGDADAETPLNYPAPNLHMNSLIVGVGGTWFQGGRSASIGPTKKGEVILGINDGTPADNRGGWRVWLSFPDSG
jgi:hypothetical protein